MSILSILFFAIVVIGAILNGLRKAGKQIPPPSQQRQRPPIFEEGRDLQSDPWKEGRYEQQPRTEEVYKSQPRSFRADPGTPGSPSSGTSSAPYRTSPAGRQITGSNERKQQSAYDWAFGTPLPPLAGDQQKASQATNRSQEEADDDLQILQPTVHVDLTEMHESTHEKMSTIHESVQVRRRREDQQAAQPAPKANRSSGALGAKLSKSDLTRALVLGEVLGEPRAKRPWRPKTRR